MHYGSGSFCGFWAGRGKESGRENEEELGGRDSAQSGGLNNLPDLSFKKERKEIKASKAGAEMKNKSVLKIKFYKTRLESS